MRIMSPRVPIAIIHPLDPLGSKIGGIEQHIRGFIKRAPEEFAITLVGFTEDRRKRPVGRRLQLDLEGRPFSNFPVCYIPEPNRRKAVPQTLSFTAGLFKHRPNLEGMFLQFHRVEPSLICPRKNTKVLFIHGNIETLFDSSNESRWSKWPSLYFHIERFFINRMSKIFVQNDDGLEFYKKIYPHLSNRLVFFPSWVDESTFFPYPLETKEIMKRSFLQQRNIDAASKMILFAGRLERAKDPMLLMVAFQHIYSLDRQVLLVVVGSGSLENDMLQYAVKNNIRSRVLFLGSLPQAEVAEVMRLSDAFLLTSSFEGMPYVVVEALATGLPVVSTNVGAISKAVHNNLSGLLVNSRSPIEIGNAVLALLSEKGSYTPAQCIEAIKPFTSHKVLGDLYKFYAQLASSRISFQS
jgi:glycosyltransferase involved in cell wall biosynthesis